MALETKIRNLREAQKTSTEELAKLLGIAKSSIWTYENGKKPIPLNHLVLFADYFEVSIDSLLDRYECPIDLKDLILSTTYKLMLNNQPLDRNEIAEVVSFIQTKRQVRSEEVPRK